MLHGALDKVRLWYWKRRYRPGRVLSKFVAPDVRREVAVIDTSEIGSGVITVRMRTWNLLYVARGIETEPAIGDVTTIEIKKLWKWAGPAWPASADSGRRERDADNTRVSVYGDVYPWPSRLRMAVILRDAGLRIYLGSYSIRVEDCSHFTFQEYGGDWGDPNIDADAESLDQAMRDANLVSDALARADVRHCFELYDASNQVVGYVHHNWPWRDPDLLGILLIAHNISRNGLSLRDALAHSRYREFRSKFEAADLAPLLQEIPSLCDEWLAYSRNKRTGRGWYLLEDGSVGRLDADVAAQRFGSLAEAVATFVVRELDFWVSIQAD